MSHDSIRGCVRPSVRRSVGRSVGRSVTSFSAGRNEDGERLISCIQTCYADNNVVNTNGNKNVGNTNDNDENNDDNNGEKRQE